MRITEGSYALFYKLMILQKSADLDFIFLFGIITFKNANDLRKKLKNTIR